MDSPIYLTSDLHELGYADIDIDFEIGTCRGDNPATNDFEFSAADLPDGAAAIYIDETEYGGIIECSSQTTESSDVTYSGYTWRGLLNKWLICPPEGEDYYVTSGDLNSIIAEILTDVLGGFFSVPDTEYGVSVSSYQFTRYCTVLEGLEKLLEENGARLYIHADKAGSGEPIVVTVEAAAAETVSGSFDEDSELDLTFTDDRMGINHLICMGSGDLADRQRVDLYIDESGGVSLTQYYTGFDERQELYDYGNVESEEELISYGTERLLAVASAKSISIDIPDESKELEIGDIAAGIFPDGSQVESPIVKKILTITGGSIDIAYEVEGEQ